MAKTRRGEAIVVIAPRQKKRQKVKGGRKIGNKKKKPSAKRYLAERRWEKNKARRAARRARNRVMV